MTSISSTKRPTLYEISVQHALTRAEFAVLKDIEARTLVSELKAQLQLKISVPSKYLQLFGSTGEHVLADHESLLDADVVRADDSDAVATLLFLRRNPPNPQLELFRLVRHGEDDATTAEYLLSCGADVNGRCHQLSTPFSPGDCVINDGSCRADVKGHTQKVLSASAFTCCVWDDKHGTSFAFANSSIEHVEKFLVAEAGLLAFNGTYVLHTALVSAQGIPVFETNEEPLFKKAGGSREVCVRRGDKWLLGLEGDLDVDWAYQAPALQDEVRPPSTGWILRPGGGQAPAPRVHDADDQERWNIQVFKFNAAEDPIFTNDLGTPLTYAAARSLCGVCSVLLRSPELTADGMVDGHGVSALQHAAFQLHPNICQLLLEAERYTEIDVVTSLGSTLHYAMEKLIEGPRLPELMYPSGRSIESGKARGQALEICQMLLESSRFSSINAVNQHGATALHMAAFVGLALVCDALLKDSRFELANAQAVGNVTVKFGDYGPLPIRNATALHCAAAGAHPETIMALLRSSRFESFSLHALLPGASSGGDQSSCLWAQEWSGVSALHCLALNSDCADAAVALEVILADERLDPSASDSEGLTATHYVCLFCTSEYQRSFDYNGAKTNFMRKLIDHPSFARKNITRPGRAWDRLYDAIATENGRWHFGLDDEFFVFMRQELLSYEQLQEFNTSASSASPSNLHEVELERDLREAKRERDQRCKQQWKERRQAALDRDYAARRIARERTKASKAGAGYRCHKVDPSFQSGRSSKHAGVAHCFGLEEDTAESKESAEGITLEEKLESGEFSEA